MNSRIAWLLLGSLVFGSARARAENAPTPAIAPAQGGGEASREARLPEPVRFDSLTTARYRSTARKLAAAVATDDSAAFRALHTDAGWAQTDDWWKAMLANQKRGFGQVRRVVGPIRGVLRMGQTGLGLPPDGAAILCHLSDKAGASMSFTLDEEGRIVKSSLWVAKELAGVRPEGAEVLWESAGAPGRRP